MSKIQNEAKSESWPSKLKKIIHPTKSPILIARTRTEVKPSVQAIMEKWWGSRENGEGPDRSRNFSDLEEIY